MRDLATIVLDVGKTVSKVSAWTRDGRVIARHTRPNERIQTQDYLALDVHGIENFLVDSLAAIGREIDVGAIIPVAHGAAAAIIDRNGLVAPPVDYEFQIPEELRRRYATERDAFTVTGSPALPDGLNLGAQLYFLEAIRPEVFAPGTQLLPWPQYWSWLLSGVAASEVTSLGCHTDLWQPAAGGPSMLSIRRGWHHHVAPLRHAGAVLGMLRPEWARRTGLSPNVQIYCGLHDSNAALLAARAFREMSADDATVLSTGTWFVSMRTARRTDLLRIESLDERRDCLVNVDVFNHAIPSARFMGGREIERLSSGAGRIDLRSDQPALLAGVARVLAAGAMVLPTFAPGCGPFPLGSGRWLSMPSDTDEVRAAVCLYIAMVADASLDLIGAQDRLLIEGRFGECEVFVRTLAALRPSTKVYVSPKQGDVSFGALRLVDPTLSPSTELASVQPLAHDLAAYRQRWRSEIASMADALP